MQSISCEQFHFLHIRLDIVFRSASLNAFSSLSQRARLLV